MLNTIRMLTLEQIVRLPGQNHLDMMKISGLNSNQREAVRELGFFGQAHIGFMKPEQIKAINSMKPEQIDAISKLEDSEIQQILSLTHDQIEAISALFGKDL